MDNDRILNGESYFFIYEVEWYLTKSACRSMADYKKAIILRYESAPDAFEKFEQLRKDRRVWQVKFRTIHNCGFIDLNNNYIFTEKSVRETHWINPKIVPLCS